MSLGVQRLTSGTAPTCIYSDWNASSSNRVIVNHPTPTLPETPNDTSHAGGAFRRDKENRLLMTLWLLTDCSFSEKQRAIKLVFGVEHSKGRLSQRLTGMKHTAVPPLWQPHWPPLESFVTMHRPSQWTYLEIKLLRQCLAFPPPNHAEFDYTITAYMMNRAKYEDHPNLPCWRLGGPYTAAEVELCASLMFWRLPKLAVKPTSQWTAYEYAYLCSRFRLEIPFASLVKTLCVNQSQFLPTSEGNISYDRLSVEKAMDNLIAGPRFGPPVQMRFNFSLELQEYFGMRGAGAPGLGPDFLAGDEGEVSI